MVASPPGAVTPPPSAVTPPPGTAAVRRRAAQVQAAECSGDGIGVAWDGTTLHVAQVHAVAGQLPTLLSTHAVGASPPTEGQVEGGLPALASVLHDACGGRPRAQVWTALDSPTTLTQIIRVPTVREGLLPNVALWTLRKAKAIVSDGMALDFEVVRTVEQDGARQLELFAAIAPRTELDHITTEFRTAGYPLQGITPNALAFRNLMRFAWPDACQGQCVLICVNDENTEVLLVSDGKPLGTRSVRTGMSSLRHAFAQHLDVDVLDPRIEECMGVLRGAPLSAAESARDPTVSPDDIFGWVRPAARRLVRNVQRALHSFEVEHGVGDGAVFLVTGRIIGYPLVNRFLGTQLGVRLHGLTDPGHAVGLRSADANAPPEDGHGRAVAIGLALAAAYTTGNFLFTFQDRLRAQHRRRAEQAVLGLVFVAVLALLGVGGLLQARVHGLQRQCERRRIGSAAAEAQSGEGADITTLLARVGAAQTTARKLAEVYYAPALVAELASLTSPPVHLLAIDLSLAGGGSAVPAAEGPSRTAAGRHVETQQGADGTNAAPGARPGAAKLVIQGIIAGQRDRVDAELVAYVLRLRQSPFLEGPVVREHRIESVDTAYLAFAPAGSDHLLFFSVETACRSGAGSTPISAPPPAPQTAKAEEVRR